MPERGITRIITRKVQALGLELGTYISILIIGAILFVCFASLNQIDSKPNGFWTIVYSVKALIEVIASTYAIFYIFVAINYRKPTLDLLPKDLRQSKSNVVVGYLCCNDFDYQAFQSIVVFCSEHGIKLWIHDDSTELENEIHIDRIVECFRKQYDINIGLLRRTVKSGGKPGAVNNLIKCIPTEYEYLFLCDSDSYILRDSSLDDIMALFEDPSVALVQCRNIGITKPHDSKGISTLSLSIDFYDAFVYFLDRYGWSPFLGHNAVLKISVLRDLGGFTSGDFADDIDYSVKLRLKGYKIKYARNVECGERHPSTYEALRLRTFKWSYGCTQILLRWSWPIAMCRNISPIGKITFFLTVGYYHFQLLLLVYLAIFYLVIPFYDPHMGGTFRLLVSSGLILLLTFMPSITFFLRHNIIVRWPKIGVCWGLTYGSQDFAIAMGILRCLFKDKVRWVSTNTKTESMYFVHFLPEVIFGICIVSVALLQNTLLLILPTTMLFAGKFLIAPFLNRLVFR